jgi:DNA primase
VSDTLRDSAARDSRDIERVKAAADIVRVVGETITLRPKGREFVGLCPFHDDHNPSLYVVPGKQIFHCFVCGAAGDVLSFVMKFHKMDFREALEYLSQRFGVALAPRRRTTLTPGTLSRSDLLAVIREAATYYQQVLAEPKGGTAAREVIRRRGISPEMTNLFLLGASPDRWDGLLSWARQQGISESALVAAGLVKPRESGNGHYDLLRNRLIFPIHDKAGQVVAFGGRRLREDEDPKYLNSPETPLFDKSSTLYALHLASRAIQRERTAIVCEGYTDVIACHQAGFTNAVGTLGTALTRGHARELRLRCERVILLFDGDEAGQRAAERAVPIFFSEPLDVRIATLSRFTDAKDPDELLKREGGDQIFRAVLEGAEDLLEYRFNRLRTRLAGAGPAGVEKVLMEEVRQLGAMGLVASSPVRRTLIEKQLAELSGLDLRTIQRLVAAGRDLPPSATPIADDHSALHRAVLTARESLLGCVLCDGALWDALEQSDRDDLEMAAYRWPVLNVVARRVVRQVALGERPMMAALLAEDPAAHEAAALLMSRVYEETGRGARLREFFTGCLRQARMDRLVAGARRMESVSDRIDQMREIRRTHGADRRVLPRPRPG